MPIAGLNKILNKPKPGVMLNPLHPLSKGLVGFWLFNEGAGSEVRDINGNHHAKLINMSANSQNSGWSNFNLKFDGSSTYGNITNLVGLPSGNENYTYGMKFKLDVLKDFNVLWTVGNNAATEIIFPTVQLDKRLHIVHFGAGNDWDTGIDIEAKTSYEFMTTWDGTNELVYINGIEKASRVHGGFSVNLQKFEIGHCFYRAIGDRHLDGAIDYFYTYDRVLSPSEALQRAKDPFCHFTSNSIFLAQLFHMWYYMRRQ